MKDGKMFNRRYVLNVHECFLIGVTVVVAMLFSASPAGAVTDTFWDDSDGEWRLYKNWTRGAPKLIGYWAYVDNGGVSRINRFTDAQSDRVFVGYRNTGTVSQTGGSLKTMSATELGFYENSYGTYELYGGSLYPTNMDVGDKGKGHFIHTGGTHNPTRTLHLGYASSGEGLYELGGTGTLAASTVSVGRAGKGTFVQSGGTHTSNSLTIADLGGSEGAYSISGGTLKSSSVVVGKSGNGRLSITDEGAHIEISKSLRFGANSSFDAVPGSTIHMSGAGLDIVNTEPSDLGGLNNLKLVFEGSPSLPCLFEVAGRDLGAVMSGFDGNFALLDLMIGGADAGSVQLVDQRDNAFDTEALYVKSLTLGSGSSLDLNGLNIYYQSFVDHGGAIDLNGGQLILVPEPATLLLLGLGGLSLRRRR